MGLLTSMEANEISNEALYAQLGHLVATMPNLKAPGPMSNEVMLWLGRAHALVEAAGNVTDPILLTQYVPQLRTGARDTAAQEIGIIVYRALATVEFKLPAAAQGAFIPAGNTFDAMAAIGKVLASATEDITIIDPYMDEKTLTTFAGLASEMVTIHLLTDDAYCKPTLKPAVDAWIAQYTNKGIRLLEARLAPARTLHDRLILVDQKTAWVLTQSLNNFAVRAPASIVRSDDVIAALKVDAYKAIWATATTL